MKYSVSNLISKFRNGTLNIEPGEYTTENELGETVMVFYIKTDELHFVTLQKNNWNRHNVYHRDGTQEEYYDR